jgi:hypothetical protein
MSAKTESQTTAQATNGTGRHPRERGASYGALMALYAGATGAFLAWRQASGKGLPERYDPLDLATAGLATHKTSRLISKERVTTPLRAPFTELKGSEGFAEVAEEPAGTGLRRTIGELLACPYCLDMWLATGYAAGLVAAPRATRFVAGVMSTVAIADFLQVAYKAGQGRV